MSTKVSLDSDFTDLR